jgi:hypothetical protein
MILGFLGIPNVKAWRDGAVFSSLHARNAGTGFWQRTAGDWSQVLQEVHQTLTVLASSPGSV